jgi:hypothetical protein
MISLRWTRELLASKRSEESAVVTDMLLQDHLWQTAHSSAVYALFTIPFGTRHPPLSNCHLWAQSSRNARFRSCPRWLTHWP